MPSLTGRPRGSFGPIAQAMLQAAVEPGTAAELATRAQVGRAAARYTVTRLVQAGELVAVEPRTRPAVLQRRQQAAQGEHADLAAVLAGWR